MNGCFLSLVYLENFIEQNDSVRSNGLMVDAVHFSRNNNGVTMSLLNGGGRKNGIDLAGITIYGSAVNGLQCALCCGVSGNGISTVNGVQVAVLGADSVNGLAIGLCNPNGMGLGENKPLPAALSLGGVNIGSQDGMQIGLFNSSASGRVLQFGLLNYNAKSYLPWCPLFNFSF